jgi:hypothetical protein
MVSTYNHARNEFVDVDAGFFIVKSFPRLYNEYKDRYALQHNRYALPRIDRTPRESPIQYRGLDRDALDDYANSDIEAEVRLALLALDNQEVDGIVYSQCDVDEVYASLGPLQGEYEIIWSHIAGSDAAPPEGYASVGFEPTYFASDHFSPSCDCMLFPRWHGTDGEGELFTPYFRQLNRHGLFISPEVASEFLGYYLSFDWTEQDHNGDYAIAEVFIRQDGKR